MEFFRRNNKYPHTIIVDKDNHEYIKCISRGKIRILAMNSKKPSTIIGDFSFPLNE